MRRFAPWANCGEAGPVEERVMTVLGVANGLGACISFGSAAVTNPGNNKYTGVQAGDIVIFTLYMALMMPLGYTLGRRIFARGTAWLRPGEPGSAAVDPAEALDVPGRMVALTFMAWLGAAVVFGAVNLAGHHDGVIAARVALSIVLGGLTTSAIAFLLIERAMRPVFALALAERVAARRRTLGVRPRLLLSWALGSAVPLLLVGLMFVGRGDLDATAATAGVWVLVALGLVVGVLVIGFAGRALSDPLDEMRIALGRVQDDDLDVELQVDDGGEIGLLQSGFNRMVAGLRERRRLHDLFGRHVGTDVARHALEHGVSLGGERREVSVLFVDVIGSTALAQSRPPDEVVDILNAFFDAVVSRVGAEGGWVNKFEGDGALCVFGAPGLQPDHADRALRAARVLRRDLLALSVSHPGLDAAVGVSSGTVVAGNVGTEQRYEYTVIGDPVNEAARLTEEAKQHLERVLASEETLSRATAEAGRWLVADELQLRGRSHPTLAYRPAPQATIERAAVRER